MLKQKTLKDSFSLSGKIDGFIKAYLMEFSDSEA